MHVTLRGELINYFGGRPKLDFVLFNCRDKTCDSQTFAQTRTLKGGGFGLTV